MGLLEALVLGLLQGLTEFLPISSTAHLRVIPALLGWDDPGASFTAVTQLGTLVAVLIYFRGDLTSLAKAALRGIRTRELGDTETRLALGILVGTLPIGIAGVLFRKAIKAELRSLEVVAGSLILLALLLLVAERIARHQRDLTQMTFTDAVAIGVAQALALVPGASRSGTTLTAGLFLGLKRETAARFSFLLSVPAVAAAGLFELKDVAKEGLGGGLLVPTLVATIVAFVSGYAAIAFLIRFLARHSTTVFIAYRLALGALLLWLLHTGRLVA
jgi:undecaprenyl-diphosphatase